MKATAHIAAMTTKFTQRGAATVGIAILVVLLMGAALLTALSLSGSVARDAASADQQVQALFIAESGMERATQRFVSGGACASLGDGHTSFPIGAAGSFIINPGTNTLFDGVTPSGTSCRVRVTGKTAVGQVTRVIESVIVPTPPNPTFFCTVPTGMDQMLIVSVSWITSDKDEDMASITRLTFDGVGLVPVDVPVRNNDSSRRVSAQNFYLLNPPVGTNIGGVLTMDVEPDGASVRCDTLAGVDQVHPIDTFIPASDPSTKGVSTKDIDFGVTITTSATNANGFVFDNLVRDHTGNVTMTAAPGRIETWHSNANDFAGARSRRGPVAASTTANMTWNWNQSKIWAIAAFTVRAATSVGSSGGRVRSTGVGGVTAWREVTVPPT